MVSLYHPQGNQRRFTMPVLPNAEFASTSASTNIEAETSFNENENENIATISIPVGQEEPSASFDQYLMSIVFMPHSMRMVCLTNLFCWMAHVRCLFYP